MGLVVSVLLHGIFFAGLYALDATSESAANTATQIQQIEDAPQDNQKS